MNEEPTVRTIPNPGSPDAGQQGCICAVMDNNHGVYAPHVTELGKDCWWVTAGCPVHWPAR